MEVIKEKASDYYSPLEWDVWSITNAYLPKIFSLPWEELWEMWLSQLLRRKSPGPRHWPWGSPSKCLCFLLWVQGALSLNSCGPAIAYHRPADPKAKLTGSTPCWARLSCSELPGGAWRGQKHIHNSADGWPGQKIQSSNHLPTENFTAALHVVLNTKNGRAGVLSQGFQSELGGVTDRRKERGPQLPENLEQCLCRGVCLLCACLSE